MALPAQIALPELPLARYLKELHEFFTIHRLQFGLVEDIVPFSERLSTPGTFRSEMASMMRSIILREGGYVPQAALLEFVMVAVGGHAIEEKAKEYTHAMQHVLKFLAEVHKSRWGIMREDPSPDEVREQGSAGIELVGPRRASVGEAFPQPIDALPNVQGEVIAFDSVAGGRGEPRRRAEIYSRSRMRDLETHDADLSLEGFPAPLMMPPFEETPEVSADSADAVQWSAAEPHVVVEPLEAVEPRLAIEPLVEEAQAAIDDEEPPRSWRRVVWIGVACALLLVAASGTVLYRRSVEQRDWMAQHLRPVASPAVVAVPVPTKPTPYGTSVKRGKVAASGSWAPSRPPIIVTEESDDDAPVQPTSPSLTQQPPAEVPASAAPGNPAPAPIYRVSPVTDYKGDSQDAAPAAKTTPGESRFVSPSAHPISTPSTRSLNVPAGAMAAKLISAPRPEYPALAKLTHMEGPVILQAVISRAGTVIETHVLRGHHLLRGAAENAVRRWRYRPYVFNGKPTNVATLVVVDFRR